MSDRSRIPEWELLETVRRDPDSDAGRAAAGELLRRHHDAVYLWCFRYVRDHERALDMAQDVMLQAFENLSRFEGRAALSSWLFVIARNRCLNEMRREPMREDIELDTLPGRGVSIDERIDEELRANRLVALANETLDAEERRAIWLRYSERMPIDAITSLLQLDQKSGARGILQRARRKLRAALDREPAEEPGTGEDP